MSEYFMKINMTSSTYASKRWETPAEISTCLAHSTGPSKNILHILYKMP
jgi:hypothetical protein